MSVPIDKTIFVKAFEKLTKHENLEMERDIIINERKVKVYILVDMSILSDKTIFTKVFEKLTNYKNREMEKRKKKKERM